MFHSQVKVFAIVVALGGEVGTDPGMSLPCPGRAVTDSINQLITMCIQQAPRQKECDNALRELEVRIGGQGLGLDWVLRCLGWGEEQLLCAIRGRREQKGAVSARCGMWRVQTLPLDTTPLSL